MLLELLLAPVVAVILLVREAQSCRAQAAAKQAEVACSGLIRY